MSARIQTIFNQNHWDQLGVGASFLCLLHCLFTPLLATALPILAATEKQAHGTLAIAILLLGMLAFIPGYKKHKNKLIPLLGLIGISLIILATVLPEIENAEIIEKGMVLMGGIIVIIAHLRNAYWCRFCPACNKEDKYCK